MTLLNQRVTLWLKNTNSFLHQQLYSLNHLNVKHERVSLHYFLSIGHRNKTVCLNHFHGLLHCSEFFMPGMVDTHIHAPQYSYAGTGLDLTLLQWLNTYTFPAESRFKDLDFAHRVYTQVVVSLLGSI